MLTKANKIATLGNFTVNSPNFILVDHQALVIAGQIDAQGVKIDDNSTIGESTGAIDALTLSALSTGGGSFDGNNSFATLLTFDNAGAGGLSLTDSEKMTVARRIKAGAGDLALTTTGSGSAIVIDKAVTAGGVKSLAILTP